MVGLTEQCGHHLARSPLAHVPASGDLRDGSDLGLIPDVVPQDGCQGLKIMVRQGSLGLERLSARIWPICSVCLVFGSLFYCYY